MSDFISKRFHPLWWIYPVIDGFHWLRLTLNLNHAVLANVNSHTILNALKELIAEAIDNGHSNAVNPNVCENCACSSEGVDVISEEHASGVLMKRASAIENEAACGRTDGLGKAKSLIDEGLAVKLCVILVAALYLLVAKLKRHLKRSESVEALCGNNCLGCACAGSYNSTLKLFHNYLPPFVIACKISSSV